ncbi:MAG: molybdopterin-dependent oxidoreductase [Nostocoides sp.]
MRTLRWPYAVSGVVAAVAGMAIGHLLAILWTGPSSSPVLAIGGTVVDSTPTPVKEWAVSTLGTADKPFLLTCVAVVTVLAAAGIGLVGRTRPLLARVLLIGLAALAAVAAASRPDAAMASPIPSMAAAGVGLVVLAWLRERATGFAEPRHTPAAVDVNDHPLPDGRRAFLAGAGVIGAGSVAAIVLPNAAGATSTAPPIALPTPTAVLPPLPTSLDAKVPGITPWRTDAGSFYRVDTEFIVPRVDSSSWTLTVGGQVDNPLTITYAELLAMPMIERDITLACVSNEVNGDLTGGASWLGVRTAEVLKQAGIRPGAEQVFSTSTSGMTISTPLAALTDGRDALIAVGMNGAPLPAAHGFPARLVTPGLYGFTGATKWVTKLTLSSYAAHSAYWTQRGWATDAPVLTEARIDVPHDGAKAGQIAIGGVAWAMHRGVKGVEVQVDGGPWQQATMGPDAGIDYWRQWYLPWDATHGKHTIVARATDDSGAVQTVSLADSYPSGATGWPTISISID